jgi:hypothetical protein
MPTHVEWDEGNVTWAGNPLQLTRTTAFQRAGLSRLLLSATHVWKRKLAKSKRAIITAWRALPDDSMLPDRLVVLQRAGESLCQITDALADEEIGYKRATADEEEVAVEAADAAVAASAPTEEVAA